MAHIYVFRDREGAREVLVHQRRIQDHSPNTWDPQVREGTSRRVMSRLETAVRECKKRLGWRCRSTLIRDQWLDGTSRRTMSINTSLPIAQALSRREDADV